MRQAISTAFAALTLLSAVLSTGCPNPACQFRGTINDAANKSMRQSMLRKGMGDFCKQMLGRNAPLKMSVDSPVIGRFYPQQCIAPEGEELKVSFSGMGYAWTNVTKKMSFTASGAAAYRYDFLVTEGDRCDVYAYFRPSRVESSDFRTYRVEGTAASVLSTFSPFGDTFGKQIVGKKLQEGFTVISYDGKSETIDFGIGILPLGKRPFHPFQVHGDDKVTYENERTEVHQNQRDFVGPIEVTESNRALYVTATLDGAAALDWFVMRREQAEPSLRLYFDYPQSGPLAAPPMYADVLAAGPELKRKVVVPPGVYYVVFDNTPTAGQVSPPNNPFDDRAAVVNYLIQIGDAS